MYYIISFFVISVCMQFSWLSSSSSCSSDTQIDGNSVSIFDFYPIRWRKRCSSNSKMLSMQNANKMHRNVIKFHWAHAYQIAIYIWLTRHYISSISQTTVMCAMTSHQNHNGIHFQKEINKKEIKLKLRMRKLERHKQIEWLCSFN